MPHSDLCNLGSWWVKIHGCAKDLIVLIHMSLIGVYWYAKLQLPASVLNLQTGWLFFVCFETICYFIIEQLKGFFFGSTFFSFLFFPANLLAASLGRGTCISCNSFISSSCFWLIVYGIIFACISDKTKLISETENLVANFSFGSGGGEQKVLLLPLQAF